MQSNAVGVDHLFVPQGPGYQGPERSGLAHPAKQGNKEMTRTLLDLGADYNLIQYQESTPLIVALQYGREEVALMLLQAGADPNVGVPRRFNDPDAETLLGLAWYTRRSKRLIRALLQNGADPNAMHVIDPEFPDTVGPEDFPAELTELVAEIKKARAARAVRAMALQKQKLPYDLMRNIQEYGNMETWTHGHIDHSETWKPTSRNMG